MVISAYFPLKVAVPAFEFCSFVAYLVERPLSLSAQSLGFLPLTFSHACSYNGEMGSEMLRRSIFFGRPAMNFD